MTKSVLCTGGAGFVGSHVAELLISSGYDVTVLDNFAQGKREWIPKACKVIEGDVTDLLSVKAAMVGKIGVFFIWPP